MSYGACRQTVCLSQGRQSELNFRHPEEATSCKKPSEVQPNVGGGSQRSHLADKWLDKALPGIPHLHTVYVRHPATPPGDPVPSELNACRSVHRGALPNAQHLHSLEQSMAYMNSSYRSHLADK